MYVTICKKENSHDLIDSTSEYTNNHIEYIEFSSQLFKMLRNRPFKVGDKVEVRWAGEFCIQDQHFVGNSWWQARISEISVDSQNYTVNFQGWDGWDEVVDISSIRWPRINFDIDMNRPLEAGTVIEMRCNSVNVPEIWLETTIEEVGEHGTYWVKTMPLEESDDTIFVARCSIRPRLPIENVMFADNVNPSPAKVVLSLSFSLLPLTTCYCLDSRSIGSNKSSACSYNSRAIKGTRTRDIPMFKLHRHERSLSSV